MDVTLDIAAWVNDNRPRNATELSALRATLARQADDAPYSFQDFQRDHFVTGYASVLWIQSIDAWSELNRIAKECSRDHAAR